MIAKVKNAFITASIVLLGLSSATAEEITAEPVAYNSQQVYQNVFDTRHDELSALLNWAAYLSGYKTNGVNPRLEFRPHIFFVENACNGNPKCRVVGWYNDQGIVYIDDRLHTLDSQFARSLVVHEFVHYLQHISGKFESGTCEDFVQREREAYATQREFIMAYGSMPSMSFHQHSCRLQVKQDSQLANSS